MLNKYLPLVRKVHHNLAMYLVVSMICVPSLFGGLAWAEVVTWPILNVTLADGTTYNTLIYLCGAISFIGLVILALVPGSKRVLDLEQSHRDFKINMEDASGAFYLAFTADRDEMFKIMGEFDSIRERLEYLMKLPDLSSREPDILMLAAQMSFVSEDLARTYSSEAVDRARTFLKARQEEISRVTVLLKAEETGLPVIRDLALTLRNQERLNIETRLRFDQQLLELVESLGYTKITSDGTVVDFPTGTTVVSQAEQVCC